VREESVIFFTGLVQGVGFRPFIYRMATQQALSGLVQNRSDGVVAEVEGPEQAITVFAIRSESTSRPCRHIHDDRHGDRRSE